MSYDVTITSGPPLFKSVQSFYQSKRSSVLPIPYVNPTFFLFFLLKGQHFTDWIFVFVFVFVLMNDEDRMIH